MVEIKIHKSVFYFLLVLGIMGISVIASKVYVDYNMMGNDITNATWVNGSFAFINLTWERIYGYPTACPTNSAITTLGDAVTCTDYTTLTGANITGAYWVNATKMNVSLNINANSLSVDTVLTDVQISNTLTCSDLQAGSSVVVDAEVDDALTIVSTTWVNSTASKGKIVYWDLTATKPTAIEGVCYWNTTTGYKCQQCYNGTLWEGICQGAVWAGV